LRYKSKTVKKPENGRVRSCDPVMSQLSFTQCYFILLKLLVEEAAEVDGRIILKWIFERLGGVAGIDWIDLAQDRDRWQALVYMMMNLQVP
jgi:hypothetical protein